MQLSKPEPYVSDPGRSLPPDEFVKAVREATPLDKIRSRTCKREDTNCKWRIGKT